MKPIFIFLMVICLGSCINNQVVFPSKTPTVVSTQHCSELNDKIDALIRQSQKDFNPTLNIKVPPVTATVSACNLPPVLTFDVVPATPQIVIKDNDKEAELLTHIEVLLSHMEELEGYIENEHKTLQEAHKKAVIKCNQ